MMKNFRHFHPFHGHSSVFTDSGQGPLPIVVSSSGIVGRLCTEVQVFARGGTEILPAISTLNPKVSDNDIQGCARIAEEEHDINLVMMGHSD
jgi:hypothetical protein